MAIIDDGQAEWPRQPPCASRRRPSTTPFLFPESHHSEKCDDSLCRGLRPRPARRRRNVSIWNLPHTRDGFDIQRLLLAGLVLLTLLCHGAQAQLFDGVLELQPMLELPRSIVFDTVDSPAADMALAARQMTTNAPMPTMITPTLTASGSTSSLPSLVSIPTTVPMPFDQSVGNNFTAPSCGQFFKTFLADPNFKACVPLSLLLQTSNGFFQAQRSLVALTQTLETTCNVNFNQCNSLMGSLAQRIQQPSTCAADLKLQNPSVVQALNGFIAYAPLYSAGCQLTDTGSYCYAAAATNQSSFESTFVYYLPLGVQLPGGTVPTCNTCLRNTMGIFAQAATNRTQPLSQTYNGAAQQIDMVCGPTFVQAARVTGAAAAMPTSGGFLGFLTFMLLLWNLFAHLV